MTKDKITIKNLEFTDNEVMKALAGPHDRHLAIIEQRLGITIASRGNAIQLSGSDSEVAFAKGAILYLQSQIIKGFMISSEDVEAAIRMASATVSIESSDEKNNGTTDEVSIATKRRMVFPRSPKQADYIHSIKTHDLVFGIGPAGTGKTYLAAAVGVWMLMSGKVERIILSRPAVEAGERLGFLPGDMREKVDPYLRPLYDALYDMMPADQVQRSLANGEIEVAPLAFMRGRTLSNSFVILDEAQNTTPVQMKMFLTRLGSNSRMVVTGDPTQVDLPHGIRSGLEEATRILRGINEIKFIEFNEQDVVRHPLVARIVKAYDVEMSTTKQVSKATVI